MTKSSVSRQPGAVIYTRVSTGEQDKHGTSPDSQRDACRRKALELGLPIIAEYYDGGISGGFLLSRTGFQAALADIREGQADTLICLDISRFSRDVEHQHSVKKAIRQAGGRLVFCDMDFDETPAGDFNFTIQGGVAEFYRKMFRERCMTGHRTRAESGIQTARITSPYGYHIPTSADVVRGLYAPEDLGKYLIDEAQAPVVRELFRRYAVPSVSLSSLIRWLNEEAIPTPTGGDRWRVSTLQYLLTNPVYKGVASYGRFIHQADEARLQQTNPQTGELYRTTKTQRLAPDGMAVTWDVPALVTEELWEAAVLRSTENKRAQSGNPSRVRMLSGRVYCPHCGGGMTSVSPGRRRRKNGEIAPAMPSRYVCSRYRTSLKDTGIGSCQPDGYSLPLVEAAACAALVDALERPEALRDAFSAWRRNQQRLAMGQEDPVRDLARAEKRLGELSQKQTATVKAQIAGIMAGAEPSAYAAVFSEIGTEKAALEKRRDQLARAVKKDRKPAATVLVPDAPKMIAEIHSLLMNPDYPAWKKRDLLGVVIEKVICRKDAEGRVGAEVVFRPGLFSAGAGLEGIETFQPLGKVRDADRDGDV